MRECPKCGYVDPPYWRPPPFGPDWDYVRYDEFTGSLSFEPLAKGDVRYDGCYVYRRTKTGKYVYRAWRPIWDAYGQGKDGWAAARRTKLYDSAGRTDKKAWGRMLKVIAQRNRRVNQTKLSPLKEFKPTP